VVETASNLSPRPAGDAYPRRARKKAWRTCRHSSASTPSTASNRWLSGRALGSRRERTAPPFGSSTP